MTHHGSCHCGRITLELDETPSDAAQGNCSLCRRYGALWHHCTLDKARVSGEGAAYVQGDRMLATWHCVNCGCVTHWTPLADFDRMAVNLRLFDLALWRDLPRRQIDCANY
jgi:hypothetical protein